MSDAFDAFWEWWGSASERIAAAIRHGTPEELVDEIGGRVSAIDPGLAWELGPGQRSKHSLTLSSEGQLALRRLTERWVGSAPAADATWEYYPARQASDNLVLAIAGRSLDPNQWAFETAIDDGHGRIDVLAHHPDLEGAPQRDRLQAVFVSLDQLLGEDDVQTWVGKIDLRDRPPSEGVSAANLRALIRSYAPKWTEEFWTVGRGKDAAGNVLVLSYNQRLKPLHHLFAETLINVDVQLARVNDQGMPPEEELGELTKLEDDLAHAMPTAINIGRMTGRGQRNMFWYAVDARGTWEAFQRILDANRTWRTTMNWQADPNWEFFQQGMFSPFAK